MPIKVALTDDHPMVLDGLQNALSTDPDIELYGCYNSGAALLNGLRKGLPDVLLLDLQLPDKTGQELAVGLLKEHPALKIIILSGIESSVVVQDMMKEGCRGYLLKTKTNKELLLHAIRTVYEGKLFLEPAIRDRLLEDVLEARSKPQKTIRKLTARERDVLQLIAMEYTNQQIAERLYISLRTVENHRHNLMQKLEVKNAVGLVKTAIDLGMTDDKKSPGET